MTFAKPPTEIHCHMLPGVDDGARDLDESLEMASVAAADGTRAIVVTPHVRSDFVTDVWLVRDAFRELRLAIAGMGIAVELHCGGELGHDLVDRLEQAELEAIALGPPGHRWLLVEAPFDGLDEEFTAATDELRERGFGIVIAHPERAAGLLEDSWPSLRRGACRSTTGRSPAPTAQPRRRRRSPCSTAGSWPRSPRTRIPAGAVQRSA